LRASANSVSVLTGVSGGTRGRHLAAHARRGDEQLFSVRRQVHHAQQAVDERRQRSEAILHLVGDRRQLVVAARGRERL